MQGVCVCVCVCSTVCVWFQFIFVNLFQEDVITRKTAKHREEEEEGKRLSDTGRQWERQNGRETFVWSWGTICPKKAACLSPTLFLLAKHQWHSLSGHGEGSRHVSISKQLYRHLWLSASGLNVQTNPSKQDVDMYTLTLDALAYQIWNRETASVATVNSQRFTSKAEMNRVIFETWPCVFNTSSYLHIWLCRLPVTSKTTWP